MPALARSGELLIIFQRTGLPADEQVARDGADAIKVAIAMLHARITLEPGDCLTIREMLPAVLPEVNRSSHYS